MTKMLVNLYVLLQTLCSALVQPIALLDRAATDAATENGQTQPETERGATRCHPSGVCEKGLSGGPQDAFGADGDRAFTLD